MAFLPPTSEPITCIDWYTRSNSNPDTNGTGICREFDMYVGVDGGGFAQEFAISSEQANSLTLAICSLILIAYVGGLIGRAMMQV